MGRVEELGSGIINITKYLKEYVPGVQPEFIEDDIFKTIIPLIPGYKAQVEAQVELFETEKSILQYSLSHIWSVKELMEFLRHKSLSGGLKKSIKKLRENGFIEYTINGKPRSSKQRYRITQKGKKKIR